MKMERKNSIIFSLIILFTFTLFSCHDDFDVSVKNLVEDHPEIISPPAGIGDNTDAGTNDSEQLPPERKGSFSISIDESTNARTILPSNINWSAFTGEFKILIMTAGTSTLMYDVTRHISNLSDPLWLETGIYDITVTAYESINTPIARGNLSDVDIDIGEAAAHIITMRAIIGGTGEGTFRWEIGVPAVDSAQMVITQMDGTQVGSAVTLTSNTINSNSSSVLSLPVGYYIVTITLERDDHAPVVRRDVLHVYQNRESFFKVDFTDNMFTNILYTVTFNYNYKNASGNDVIGTVPVTHGNLVTAPAPEPTRTSYVFDGWYIDNNTFSNGWNFTAEPVIRDTTLYAKWLRDLAYAEIQIDGLPLVYDGTAHTPVITVEHDGDPLTEGEHYSVSYDTASNTNAGTSSVTITAIANGGAAGFKTVDFAINRADPTVAAAPSASAVAPGSVLSSSALTGGTVNGIAAEPDLTGTWAWQDGTQTVNASGSFTAVFTPDSGNYGAVTVSVNVAVKTVIVTENGVSTGYDDLTEALGAINTAGAGNYTVTLYADQTLVRYTIGAGVNITFVGVGDERTIQRTGAASTTEMFRMNVSGGSTDHSITLGNNITVIGRDVLDQSVLVTLTNGTFTMQEGSKITGHNTSNTDGTVNINGANGNFVMNGGEITENHSSANGTDTNGGIRLINGTFTMNGGRVTGNTQGPDPVPSDIYVSSTSFSISGNAQIGALRLNATSNTAFARVNVGNNFTGSVGILHLRGNNANIATSISFFRNNAILQAASGHTLTAADVAKFPLGNFMPTVGVDQSISPDFIISDSGADIGHLIPVPILIHNEADLRRVGTGQLHNGRIWSLHNYYILMANIMLNASDPNNWTPIGSLSGNAFGGVFDGNWHTITGLRGQQGMFNRINQGGIVQNLGLENVNIEDGASFIGGIAGQLDGGGTITNCFVSGRVVSNSSTVGGIAGIAGGMIANSYSTAIVRGVSRIGGIVGEMGFSGRVINCYSTGNSISSADDVGGIAGRMSSGAIIENSYATGGLDGTLNVNNVGGITGQMIGTAAVRNCAALNWSISTARSIADSAIARVSGNTAGTRQNNYGRSDMQVTANGTIAPRTATVDGNDGASITVTNWHSASWWQNTALFDPAIWDLTEGRLPRLLNMPGGLDAQDPVVVP